MNGTIRANTVYPDKPWRRFAFALPLSVVIVSAMLFGVSLLKPEAMPRIQFNAIEAYLIEPSAQPAGLRGGPVPAAAKLPTAKKVRPTTAPRTHARKVRPAAASLAGKTSRPAQQPNTPVLARPLGAPGQGTAAPRRMVAGTDSGVANDSAGALAIYAPLPKIPDDLREEDFESVAVAHFRVLGDGTVTVSLVAPTRNRRLDEILLESLGQWRFYPAKKGGITVDSEFDVRIPISVQ
jgi:periplasmic protein TonB